MPDGIPRWVRCYDNGGRTTDRYTVCYTGRAGTVRYKHGGRAAFHRDMSEDPFHPLGFGMWGEAQGQHCDVNKWGWAPPIGGKNHLGTRITFRDLPEPCQRLVIQDYKQLWEL